MQCQKIEDRFCAGRVLDLGGKKICIGEKKITKNPRSKYRAIIKSCNPKTGKLLTRRIRNPKYKSRKSKK